jgi:uncharacterized membrane protein YdbT with pleckstrin-like domain
MTEPPDWVTLTEGETVIWHSPPSLRPYLLGMTVPVGLVLAGLAVLVVPVGAFLPGGTVGLSAAARVGGAGLLALAGLVGVAVELLRWYSHRYLLTTEEVYHKRGLVSRSVTNVRIDRIETTQFTQSALGRLLSYGTVRVATAGTDRSEVVLSKVTAPDDVVARITRLLDES